MSVLEVKDLTVQYGKAIVVNHISFSLEKGEILGIVGESGSGKTRTAYAIMGISDPTATVSTGEIHFEGKNLLELSEKEMQAIRGGKIVMIPQDPAAALNPVECVGKQVKEMSEYHRPDIHRSDQKKFIVDLLEKVGIPDPEKRYTGFPHELSGGMNQRMWIAMALAVKPTIIIADEPTTSLDVTVQKKILNELISWVRESGISFILVTHNLGLIAEYTDRVLVMKKGEIVEQGSVFQVLDPNAEHHPYTEQLLKAVPRI